MNAIDLRDRIRLEIGRLEQAAHGVKNAEDSTITEVIGAEGKIELCQELKMLLDAIAIDSTPGDLEETPEPLKSPIEERYRVILQAAQQAVGKRLDSSQRKEDVLIRLFTAYRLRAEGFSMESIGKVLNRNHSTVVHYVRKRIPDMLSLPHIYRSEVEMYNKMNEILGEV